MNADKVEKIVWLYANFLSSRLGLFRFFLLFLSQKKSINHSGWCIWSTTVFVYYNNYCCVASTLSPSITQSKHEKSFKLFSNCFNRFASTAEQLPSQFRISFLCPKLGKCFGWYSEAEPSKTTEFQVVLFNSDEIPLCQLLCSPYFGNAMQKCTWPLQMTWMLEFAMHGFMHISIYLFVHMVSANEFVNRVSIFMSGSDHFLLFVYWRWQCYLRDSRKLLRYSCQLIDRFVFTLRLIHIFHWWEIRAYRFWHQYSLCKIIFAHLVSV